MIKLDGFEKGVVAAGFVLAVVVWFGPHFLPGASTDLGRLTEHLPYHLEPTADLGIRHNATDGQMGYASAMVDYRGDGNLCYVRYQSPGISGYSYTDGKFHSEGWAHNFDSRFTWARKSMAVFGGMDANGDGRDDVIISGRTEDRSEFGMGAYDRVAHKSLGWIELPIGEDRRPDGSWDGYYIPVGSFAYQAEDGTRQKALLVCCGVLYDGVGRGVYALDFSRGEILWSYLMGPSPNFNGMEIIDLDGDGFDEIVLGTRSPCNLGSEKINGTCDNESILFVLDGKGQLLWSRTLGSGSYASYATAVDLSGDGNLEIISALADNTKPYGEISVWNGTTSEEITKHVIPDGFRLLEAMPGSGESSPYIIVLTRNLGLIQLTYRDGELWQTKAFLPGKVVALCGYVDFLPEPGPEFLISVDNEYLLVLGSDFSVLASQKMNTLGIGEVDVWPIGKDNAVILSRLGSFKLTASTWSQRTDLYPAIRSAGSMFLLGGLIFLRRRNRDFYRMKLDINDPDVLRELRLRLLSDLELSGHGAVGILKSLRRLLWNLESRCAGLGGSEEMTKQLNSLLQDFNSAVLPHVRNILGLAEKAHIARPSVLRTDEALSGIEQQLNAIASSGFLPEKIQEELIELQESAEEAEAGLQKIRRTVEDLFRSDFTDVMSLVLRARKEDLEVAKVKLVQEGFGGDKICRIDPSQLEFMLDNLIGNAIRAMGDSPEPRLSLSLSLGDGFVVCDVCDTGWGIAPEDWIRVMETPYSSREGGGLGLFETRRLLRLYGGMITIKESKPGEGTTIRLVIPEAR